jgi:hypothetical protein
LPNKQPFDNVNQWSAAVGGPIVRDKTFFFVNYEGIRVLLPTSIAVNIPSPQFQAATLANIAATQPAQVPFYQQMFSIYNNAPGASSAQNVLAQGTDPAGNVISGPGCGTFTQFGNTSTACGLQFRSTAGNFTHEWLLSGRVDQNIGNNDRVFVHFRTDHGVQATYTDPLNSVFNAQSDQPQYEGQLNWTHTLNPSSVNQLIAGGYGGCDCADALSVAVLWHRLLRSGTRSERLATRPQRNPISNRRRFLEGDRATQP